MEDEFNKEEFLLVNEKELFDSGFISSGWITIYHSTEDGLIYSYLVDDNKIQDELIKEPVKDNLPDWVENKEAVENNYNFDFSIHCGSEGRPSIFGNDRYESFADKGIEPLIYCKHFYFDGDKVEYVDVSEEFVLYFNLYEKGNSKHNRTFYSISDLGELEEVIKIESKKVKVKLKYLNEYLAIRKMNLVSCCDFSKSTNENIQNHSIEIKQEIINTDSSIFKHTIKNDYGKTESWIVGKSIIKHKSPIHLMNKKKEYAEFIVGYDDDGNEIMESCDPNQTNNLTYVWFDKKVLDKYYFNPTIYTIDSFSVKSYFFSLKFDINLEKHIAVLMDDLGRIPYKEQMYWKLYNVAPQYKLSYTYIKTMWNGEKFDKPEIPDLLFKHHYLQFNKKWEKKFGWKFFKPLAIEQQYRFDSLHIPVSNNVKSFCDEILTINILIVDRLNEEELLNYLPKNEIPDKKIEEYINSVKKTMDKDICDYVEIKKKPQVKGINKLKSFLEHQEVSDSSEIILFLKNLYKLRSGLLAHSFSNRNKDCRKAMEHFHFEQKTYQKIARDIFERAIRMLNFLEEVKNKISIK